MVSQSGTNWTSSAAVPSGLSAPHTIPGLDLPLQPSSSPPPPPPPVSVDPYPLATGGTEGMCFQGPSESWQSQVTLGLAVSGVRQVPSLILRPLPPSEQHGWFRRGEIMTATCSICPTPTRASFAAQSRRTSIPPTPANMTAAVSSTRSPATSASCAALRSASLWAWPWTVRGWMGGIGPGGYGWG